MISKSHRVAAWLVSLLIALGSGRVFAADPARAPIVILISIDGLAAYNFDDPLADVPTLRWMAANGARAGGGDCRKLSGRGVHAAR